MRGFQTLVIVGAFALLSSSAFAQSKMEGSMKMMSGGDVLAVMPDGHMGTTKVSDTKMMGDMKKMAQPMKGCSMYMTGTDGKTMMIDTSSEAMMKECEKIAK